MLPKKYRISKDKEYKKIFRRSKKVDTENFVFRVAKNNLNVSRFGFVVSNKIDKRATRRNGIKRRLRTVVGENLDKIKLGFDVVILVKRPLNYPYNYKDIREELLKGLCKTALMD